MTRKGKEQQMVEDNRENSDDSLRPNEDEELDHSSLWTTPIDPQKPLFSGAERIENLEELVQWAAAEARKRVAHRTKSFQTPVTAETLEGDRQHHS